MFQSEVKSRRSRSSTISVQTEACHWGLLVKVDGGLGCLLSSGLAQVILCLPSGSLGVVKLSISVV